MNTQLATEKVAEKVRKVLTPCPPNKRCAICEARLNEVFGSADKQAKYIHQAKEATQAVKLAISVNIPVEIIESLARRAATYGRMALEEEGVK